MNIVFRPQSYGFILKLENKNAKKIRRRRKGAIRGARVFVSEWVPGGAKTLFAARPMLVGEAQKNGNELVSRRTHSLTELI